MEAEPALPWRRDVEPPEELRVQRAAWEERPLVRNLYNGWFDQISHRLASVEGPTVELGCGIGTFKERHPDVIATDVMETPWAERIVSAEELPFPDASVANLVLIDVLHHIPQPMRFFEEARRTLRPDGRLICLEPYCSPVSTVIFKLLHHEETELGVDPFSPGARSSNDPFESNQALPTLMFWRHAERFAQLYPELSVIERRRLATLVYPLSGGFTKRALVPHGLVDRLLRLETRLQALTSLMAFRCLVVVERTNSR